jgi:oligopeptide transport system substrate-binding protein
MNEAPILPIYHHARVFLMRPSVKGWHTNPLDTHAYKFVSLEAGGK